MKRNIVLVCLGAMLLACASSPPPPESPLRVEARSAVEAGSRRLTGRHFAAAARSFEQAAQIYNALDDPAAESATLRNQAEALRLAGNLDAATTVFERTLAIDRFWGWTDGQARSLAGLARCSSARGEVERAIRQAEQALGLAVKSEAFRATLEIDFAVYLLARGNSADRRQVIELLNSASSRAMEQGEPRIGATAHLHMGRAQRFFGSLDLAADSLRLALTEFRALDDPEGLARTHEALGRLLVARNQLAAAKRHLEQARRGYEFLEDEAALTTLDEFLVEVRE